MRVFVAIKAPEEVLNKLQELQEKAMERSARPAHDEENRLAENGSIRIPKSRWRATAREKMHLTIQFLGNDVKIHEIERIKKALEEATGEIRASVCGELEEGKKEIKAFNIRCAGVGAFPKAKRASVLWAGVQGEELINAAEIIRKKLKEAGFGADKKFSPHITFARCKFPSNVEEFVEENKEFRWFEEEWKVDGIELIESVHSLGGYEYKRIGEYKFG
ncbi:MAG: RNA 2',3'-cyclic phosphodiesterase [Candidatus Micrarchaeota archaeon]